MIAFVLSDGRSLGAIQAGMLEALLERDIGPDALVVTSIGAANAAFLPAELTLYAERPLDTCAHEGPRSATTRPLRRWCV